MPENKIYSQAEIARELDCSRSNVSQLIKKSFTKMYKKIFKENLADNPRDALLIMMSILKLSQEEDIIEFFNMLPENIKQDARNSIN